MPARRQLRRSSGAVRPPFLSLLDILLADRIPLLTSGCTLSESGQHRNPPEIAAHSACPPARSPLHRSHERLDEERHEGWVASKRKGWRERVMAR